MDVDEEREALDYYVEVIVYTLKDSALNIYEISKMISIPGEVV